MNTFGHLQKFSSPGS